MNAGDIRLLAVSQGLVVPSCTLARCLVSSSDVIHSFACPVLGIKCDAVPGRASTLVLSSVCSGCVAGACSEICGAFHGFMPLTLLILGF